MTKLDYSRGGAARDPAKIDPRRDSDGATPGQVKFIAILAKERGVKVDHPKKRPWTFREASDEIKRLKALPKKRR